MRSSDSYYLLILYACIRHHSRLLSFFVVSSRLTFRNWSFIFVDRICMQNAAIDSWCFPPLVVSNCLNKGVRYIWYILYDQLPLTLRTFCKTTLAFFGNSSLKHTVAEIVSCPLYFSVGCTGFWLLWSLQYIWPQSKKNIFIKYFSQFLLSHCILTF